MLRETNVRRLHWADKTMSVMREQQLEACEKRLRTLPEFSLFGQCSDVHAEQLWQCSYQAQEQPRMTQLHTIADLRAGVLAQLPAEAALLSMDEHLLVERLITLDGQAELLEWEEMSAAESLVRRMWCSISRQDGRIVLNMPAELLLPLTMILSTHQHEEIRDRLMRHDAVIRALLYIGGLLHYEEPLYHLMNDVLNDSYAASRTLALRYLRVAYDYAYDRSGEMLVLHPGLADPEQFIAAHPMPDGLSMELDEETMRGAMEGLLPEEQPLFDRLFGLLIGATRPELTEEGAVEDLRMLAKQGVSLKEMQEVLSSMLLLQPTDEMLSAVEALHRLTPRWGSLKSEALQ